MLDKKSLVIILIIFLFGFATITLIFNTEPEAQREAATKRSAMLVDVEMAVAGDFRPTIIAMGNVKPAQHIVLRPRVAGEVISRSSSFVPGRLVDKNEVLLQLDDSDYRNILAQRQSQMEQANAALSIEMGEQAAAKADYERLNRTLTDMQKALVLREPQLNMAKADVAAAKAALSQAKVDVERTQIKAPFAAQIVDRQVNVGSQVAPGDALAELLGVEVYWVEATIPTSKLRWLDKNKESTHENDEGRVKIHDRNAWQKHEFRIGKLHSIIAELDQQTRMARLLIEVKDPLALQAHRDEPALVAGAFVECELQAKTIQNVVRMPRQYLRKNDSVWVMHEGKLSVRSPDIVFRDAEYVYIRSGIEAGENIVISNLSNISEGAELRIKATPENSSTGES